MTQDDVRQNLPDNGQQLNNNQNCNGNSCIDTGSNTPACNEFTSNAGKKENGTAELPSNLNGFQSTMLSEMQQQMKKHQEETLQHMKNLFDPVLRGVNSHQVVDYENDIRNQISYE